MITKLIEFIIDKIKLAFGLMTGKAKIANKSDTAVVCIGMQQSAKYGSCPGSTLDSNSMAALLSKYGDVTLLQDRNATIEAVRLALINALNSKLCIFYYSGHGGQKQDRNGQNGISEYLCLNNGPLHDYEIWDLISKSKGRVVMIFDCCHSATMYRDHVFGGVEKFKNTGFAFKMLQVPLTLDTKNILVWSGCPANDYSYGSDEGGVFTNGIRSKFESSDTYDEVWKRAKNFAKSQHPVRTILGEGFDGPVFK